MSSNKLSALWLSIVDLYVHPHHPSIIFLSETMASEKRISKVDLFLGFFLFYLCVENRGKSCGLCMFWSQNIQVIVVEFGQNLIALKYIYFFIILSYFVMSKKSYSIKYIKIKYHFFRDHAQKKGC